MALNVPVLPVALKGLPEAMIGPLHSVMLRKDDDINKLDDFIAPDALALLVNLYDDPTLAQYVCADEFEDRAALFARYASEVRRLIGKWHAPVLQSSALSSFHIPSEITSDLVWTNRHDPDNQKGLHHNRLQRRERLALQWHACRSGARLIIYPEILTGKGWGKLAAIMRWSPSVGQELGSAKRDSRQLQPPRPVRGRPCSCLPRSADLLNPFLAVVAPVDMWATRKRSVAKLERCPHVHRRPPP